MFDGVQNVLERCNAWYENRLNEEKARELVREDEKESVGREVDSGTGTKSRNSPEHMGVDRGPTNEMPSGVHFFIAEPIVDRKSSFVGRACRISDPSEVRLLRFCDIFPSVVVRSGPTSSRTPNVRPTDS